MQSIGFNATAEPLPLHFRGGVNAERDQTITLPDRPVGGDRDPYGLKRLEAQRRDISPPLSKSARRLRNGLGAVIIGAGAALAHVVNPHFYDPLRDWWRPSTVEQQALPSSSLAEGSAVAPEHASGSAASAPAAGPVYAYSVLNTASVPREFNPGGTVIKPEALAAWLKQQPPCILLSDAPVSLESCWELFPLVAQLAATGRPITADGLTEAVVRHSYPEAQSAKPDEATRRKIRESVAQLLDTLSEKLGPRSVGVFRATWEGSERISERIKDSKNPTYRLTHALGLPLARLAEPALDTRLLFEAWPPESTEFRDQIAWFLQSHVATEKSSGKPVRGRQLLDSLTQSGIKSLYPVENFYRQFGDGAVSIQRIAEWMTRAGLTETLPSGTFSLTEPGLRHTPTYQEIDPTVDPWAEYPKTK